MTKKLKTNKISAAGKPQCLLHFGVRLASCSRGWAQHCRMTVHLSAFCLCPRQIQMHSLHWEEEWREQGGLYGETSF